MSWIGTNKTVKVAQNRKERYFSGAYMAILKDSEDVVVDMRRYESDSRAYVCIWIHDSKSSTHLGAGAHAGGYGYHRSSCAAQEAFDRMGLGVDVVGRMDGVGEQAMKSGIKAVMSALGYDKSEYLIVEAHA